MSRISPCRGRDRRGKNNVVDGTTAYWETHLLIVLVFIHSGFYDNTEKIGNRKQQYTRDYGDGDINTWKTTHFRGQSCPTGL